MTESRRDKASKDHRTKAATITKDESHIIEEQD
jgi:hypothetical protein